MSNSSNGIAVLLGKGDGTFAPPIDGGTEAQGFPLTVGDFNNDGIPDLVNWFLVLLGNGNGTFRQVLAPFFAGPAVVQDFNGDGKQDVAFTNADDDGVLIFPGNGDGTFGPPVLFIADGSPVYLAAGDFNGDGKPDLAVENQMSKNVSVLINTTP